MQTIALGTHHLSIDTACHRTAFDLYMATLGEDTPGHDCKAWTTGWRNGLLTEIRQEHAVVTVLINVTDDNADTLERILTCCQSKGYEIAGL